MSAMLVFIQLVTKAVVMTCARYAGLSRFDTVGLVFCAYYRSLSLGVLPVRFWMFGYLGVGMIRNGMSLGV